MACVVAFFMIAALKAASVAAAVISFSSSLHTFLFFSFLNKLQRFKPKVAFIFNLPFLIVFLLCSFFWKV